jgi:hypothetical protein
VPIVLRLLKEYCEQLAGGNDTPVFWLDQFTEFDADREAWK